ncbi:cytochrome c oxidase subunit 7A2, mitochondrial isoform X2 [Amblyraja radiata]|uniref:cytochrome c oxidase subunit 7A2, mitochondrial isoform X2 n=1 Tax=Amblyraja radiata TaxID=386614 RepID=UPI001401EF3D|nr:cytochrome c oxidase subunit 7A2, mitochondrial isoform X2 [Amblyraja radiata]
MSGLATRGLRAFHQLSQRTFSTAARKGVENRVREKQKIFQADNGLPIHLKGGVSDAILYRLTMALTVGGTIYVLYKLFDIALPSKK